VTRPEGDAAVLRWRRLACAAALLGLGLSWGLSGASSAQVRSAFLALTSAPPPSQVDALPDFARLCREAARVLPENALVGLVLPFERPGLQTEEYWDIAQYHLAPRRVLPLNPPDPASMAALPVAGWLLVYRGRSTRGELVLDLMPAGSVSRVRAPRADAPREAR
jgi:hypothetical protein